MKKTLQELTTELQTLCHEGHATDVVCIKILDGYYNIEGLKPLCNVTKEDETKTLFVIEAGV